MTAAQKTEYPLYPDLTKEGGLEAQALMDVFKEKAKEALTKVVDEIFGQLYCDVAMYIQSDSWSNFRNDLLEGFKNYNNRRIQAEYDFAQIRQCIYKDFREDIIKDLDQDNLKRIEQLEKELKFERESRQRY